MLEYTCYFVLVRNRLGRVARPTTNSVTSSEQFLSPVPVYISKLAVCVHTTTVLPLPALPTNDSHHILGDARSTHALSPDAFEELSPHKCAPRVSSDVSKARDNSMISQK